jgi:hypothetical protein
MPATREQQVQTTVLGRISREPEGSRTIGGTPICRLTVATEAPGPASSPVVVALYIAGDLARRCLRGLGTGDLIEGFGDLRPLRKAARWPEVVAEDVKLREEVSGRASAARAGVGA